MDELGFRNRLLSLGMPKKQIQDTCSRIKAIERTLFPYYEIEAEFDKNECIDIFRFFDDKGALFNVYCENIHVPVGQYYLSSYKLALKKYVDFLIFSRENKT